MKTTFLTLSAIAFTALAACNKQEAASNDAVTMESDMNAMAADPANPFSQSEMAMDRAMTAAVGTDAGDSWVRKMIEHHRGAVDMSRIVLTQSPTEDVAKMAQMTIDMQGKEIADLEKMVATGNSVPASAELYRPAAMQMHNAMMAAKGASVSETFNRKMLAHHQGAVAMSDVALANGVTGAVRAQIEKTKASQQKEIAHVEAMLRGELMTAAAVKPAAKPAATTASAATRSTEAKPAAPKVSAAKPASAKPKVEPAVEPKAADAPCTPEHRAAGHC